MAPEPLEDALARELPEAAQVVIVGNQRSFLAALVARSARMGSKPSACKRRSTLQMPGFRITRRFARFILFRSR